MMVITLSPMLVIIRKRPATFIDHFSINQTMSQHLLVLITVLEMDTYTVGAKVGMKLSNGNELAFRLEYYHQTPKNSGFEQVGALADLQLYAPIKAFVFQVNYSF